VHQTARHYQKVSMRTQGLEAARGILRELVP